MLVPFPIPFPCPFPFLLVFSPPESLTGTDGVDFELDLLQLGLPLQRVTTGLIYNVPGPWVHLKHSYSLIILYFL